MKILIDECLPNDLVKMVPSHAAKTVVQMGWGGISNGELLKLAQDSQFEVFITVDKNIAFLNPSMPLNLTIIILRPSSNRIQDIEPFAKRILSLLTGKIESKVYVLEKEE